MAWNPRGAHLLLQIRPRVCNGEWEATCREWYSAFRAAAQPMAACPSSIKRSRVATSFARQLHIHPHQSMVGAGEGADAVQAKEWVVGSRPEDRGSRNLQIFTRQYIVRWNVRMASKLMGCWEKTAMPN
jgi:hypothetical protein